MNSVFKITISKKKLKNFFIFFLLLSPLLIITFFSSNVFAWVGPTRNPPMENVAMVNSCAFAFGGGIPCANGCLIHACSIIAVGGECGGGKVAYHDGAGGGLIAATVDSDGGSGIEWGCEGQSVGTTSAAIGTGLANTNTIVAFHNNTANFGGNDYYTFGGDYSTIGCHVNNNGTVAAKLCADLTTGGHNDWFLPSKDELALLYASKDAVGGYASASYWSSSEYDTNIAWTQDFYFGYHYISTKNNTLRVRCIRAF